MPCSKAGFYMGISPSFAPRFSQNTDSISLPSEKVFVPRILPTVLSTYSERNLWRLNKKYKLPLPHKKLSSLVWVFSEHAGEKQSCYVFPAGCFVFLRICSLFASVCRNFHSNQRFNWKAKNNCIAAFKEILEIHCVVCLLCNCPNLTMLHFSFEWKIH